MERVLRIAGWSSDFENNRTRELKSLNWVPIPNRHDSDGYTELLDHEDGPAHFGAWVALVQVASRCEPRGTLMRDRGRPHDAASLSRITRFPRNIIESAIERLVGIGWIDAEPLSSIEEMKMSHQPAGMSQDDAGKPQRPALKERRERNKEPPPPPARSDLQKVEEDGLDLADDWRAVTTALVAFPVGDADTAIKTAREKGCSPREIQALIAHAALHKSHWESPSGVLHRRICNAHPGRPTGESWPPPRGSAKAQTAIEKALTSDEEETKRGEELRAAEAQRMAEDERKFGEKLNEMSREELSLLADEALVGPARQKFEEGRGSFPAGFIRERLLAGMRRRSERQNSEALV